MNDKKPIRSKEMFLQEREKAAQELKERRKKLTPWDGKNEPNFEVETPWDGKQ